MRIIRGSSSRRGHQIPYNTCYRAFSCAFVKFIFAFLWHFVIHVCVFVIQPEPTAENASSGRNVPRFDSPILNTCLWPPIAPSTPWLRLCQHHIHVDFHLRNSWKFLYRSGPTGTPPKLGWNRSGVSTKWSAPPPRTSAPVHSLRRAQRHGTSCRRIYGH